MKFNSIQALRALAAIIVVTLHAQGIVPKYTSTITKSGEWMGCFGAYGVDLFFVISGFAIAYTIHRSNPTPGEFLLRRLIRIVPLYWSLTLFYVFLAWVLPVAFNDGSQVTATHLGTSIAFVSFLNNPVPILGVGWTLEYEMLFYLVSFVVLLFTSSLFVPVTILFMGFIVFGNIDFGFVNLSAFFKNQIIFEFILGLAIAKFYLEKRLLLRHGILLLIALAMTLFATEGYRLFYAGIPAAIIVLLALRYDYLLMRLGAMKWLKVMGDASYCLYLIQVFIIPCLAKLFFQFFPGINTDLFVLTTLCIAVISSIIMHRWFEQPLLRALNAIRFYSLPARRAHTL